jgi:hypothetical protein
MAVSEAWEIRLCLGVILALLIALGAGLVTWLNQREMLHETMTANDYLRKTLGEMSMAITEKDRELDRLSQHRCQSHDGGPAGSGAGPGRRAAPR